MRCQEPLLKFRVSSVSNSSPLENSTVDLKQVRRVPPLRRIDHPAHLPQVLVGFAPEQLQKLMQCSGT